MGKEIKKKKEAEGEAEVIDQPAELIAFVEVPAEHVQLEKPVAFPGTVVGMSEKENGNVLFACRVGLNFADVAKKSQAEFREAQKVLASMPPRLQFADPMSSQLFAMWMDKMCAALKVIRKKTEQNRILVP